MISLLALAAFVGLIIYIYRLNLTLRTTPPEAVKHAIKPLTDEEAKAAYERIMRDGLQWKDKLPTRHDRRYAVVGGSGLVGGQIVLSLLANGTAPEAIRIIDLKTPMRDVFTTSGTTESKVPLVEADITTELGALAGLALPWPEDLAKLPLTVFHTVGVIRPQERSPLFWDRVAKVNVTGTAHVIAAARKVGASILIFTSSASVENREVGWFPPPWKKYPRNFVQYLNGSDIGKPLKPDDQFQTNYCRSKALAERLACDADEGEGGLRTGAIRPGNGVYGERNDFILGAMLQHNIIPSFNATFVQSWAHAINVALAHLQLEDALLGQHANKVAGRPYIVTDHGPALKFLDTYTIMRVNCIKGFTALRPPPLLFLSAMYVVEWWALASAHFPLVKKILGEPEPPLGFLQPGTAVAGITSIVDDSVSRKSPAEGGIGYKSACGTVEGMCRLVGEWNEHAIQQELERTKQTK